MMVCVYFLYNCVEYILTWDTAKKLPWDLVLLFGGGFALAKGAEVSGLAVWIGSKMSGLSQVNIVGMEMIYNS